MAISRTPPPAAPTPKLSPPARRRIVPVVRVADCTASAEGVASAEVARYEVGYKRPPKHTQFQPGRSGNPNGRSKGAKGLKTIIRKSLTEKILARTASGEKRISRIEAVIHKTIELAMKGNARALDKLLTLYALAVPDISETARVASSQELTATDQAILDAFITNLRDGEQVQ